MKHQEHANIMEHERAGLMKHGNGKAYVWILAVLALLLLVAGTQPGIAAAAVEDKQSVFASPEEAKQALVNAAKAKDRTALAEIFGPGYDKLLSGDAVQDNRELEQFVTALDQSAKLEPAGTDKVTLAIGADNWPFPIPIVKHEDKWSFDTATGTEEILNRRIGENELSAIATCRAYVLGQWEYFTEGDHDSDGVAEYAQHFSSTPGHKDGLYWDTAEGEKPSPMGALVAAARAEGYPAGQRKSAAAAAGKSSAENKEDTATRQRTPYHGYFFKILKRQGPHAPGGKYDYIINGNMIAGYALIAYPDKHGSSGVMTFMVNQQGRVYEKNLGPDTLKIARAITEYDPDASWKLVKD
ncbi:MAG TPA: DUF2950 domain-containing protein [Candidatus Angelobacter sp.]